MMHSWTVRTLLLVVLIFFGCGSFGDDKERDIKSSASKYQLRGAVTISQSETCDADVNNPDEAYRSNDTPDQARMLATPVKVGGYLNVAGSGAKGRSFADGDLSDWYAVRLDAGQTIDLFIADSDNADLDLGLYDPEDPAEPVSVSNGSGPHKSIEVEGSDTYLLLVSVVRGASNYILSIADQPDSLAFASVNRDDFVPGTAIVKFVQTDFQVAAQRSIKTFAEDTGMLTAGRADSRPVLMTFDTAEQRLALSARLNLSLAGNQKLLRGSPGEEDKIAEDTLAIIAALNQRDDVVYAEPNYLRRTLFTPNDTFFYRQWSYPLIGLEAAWDTTLGSSDVVVAVVDSGVIMDHPDLAGKLSDDGYDFVSNIDVSLDSDGWDDDPSDPGTFLDYPDVFHGTHVAGIIAATVNNNLGVAGVGGDTMVMPVRAMGQDGEGTLADLLNAVRYAAGMENDSNRTPLRPADIINLSLGSDQSSLAEEELLQEVIEERGIVVVAAAGNERTSSPVYPASYPGVISVSAVDPDSNLAYYSNFGQYIDVAAPGGSMDADRDGDGIFDGVYSTSGVLQSNGTITSNYNILQGTSMATPHVAGVIALMKSVAPAIGPDHIRQWLTEERLTTDMGAQGWDEAFGYGLINAEKAVLTAQGEDFPVTGMEIEPSALDFGFELTSLTLAVTITGDEPLAVTGVQRSVPWLAVDDAAADGNGLGTYTVALDRGHGELSLPGDYNAQITFTSHDGSRTVPVSLTVPETDTSIANAGLHYVLLLDPDTEEIRHKVAVSSRNGQYEFCFEQVAAGDYYLIAGSDPDNSGTVGEAGESGGRYPIWESSEILSVDGNLDNLDFITSLRQD